MEVKEGYNPRHQVGRVTNHSERESSTMVDEVNLDEATRCSQDIGLSKGRNCG